MNKTTKIILSFTACAVALLTIYNVSKVIKNERGYDFTKEQNKFILCNKDYSNIYIKDFIVKNKVKISDNYGIVYYAGQYNVFGASRVDGCSGNIETVNVTLDKNYNVDSSNSSVIFYKNRFLISLNKDVKQSYAKLYVIDLAKDKIDVNNPENQNYTIVDLGLSNNETFLHYDISCGEGCDIDTRMFEATTTEKGLKISVFSKTEKDDILVYGKMQKVNKKLREVEYVLPWTSPSTH